MLVIVIFVVFNTLIVENINECASDPCQNGVACNDSVNGYMCLCGNGYRGDNCTGKLNLYIISFMFIKYMTEADPGLAGGRGGSRFLVGATI